MPNWTFNHLTLEATTGAGRTALAIFVNSSLEANESEFPSELRLTFNGLIPMPEELRIGGVPASSIYTEEEVVEAIKKLSQPDLEEHKKERIQKNLLQYTNQMKYGFSDWYSWSIAKWGTKWDACDTDITHQSEDVLQIRFNTAWNAPHRWLHQLFTMEEFMPLCIRYFHEDEGEGCYGPNEEEWFNDRRYFIRKSGSSDIETVFISGKQMSEAGIDEFLEENGL